MAVFTKLDAQTVESLLQGYSIGSLKTLTPISEGIENTNYFLDTLYNADTAAAPGSQGIVKRWVLTIFENLPKADLPYFCALTAGLAAAGIAVPAPALNRRGEALFELMGKQGVIVPCLSGASVTQPGIAEVEQVGAWLAKMHIAAGQLDLHRPLPRDLNWMRQNTARLAPHLLPDELVLLEHYVARYAVYADELAKCPQGTVHGDLFRDNVLFEQGRISGVIDFYHACDATLLFDLAVVANDWVTDELGRYRPELMLALTTAYQQQRPWNQYEQAAWAKCLELAALRFWVSRLVSLHLPGYQQRSVSGETIKNPDEMKQILLAQSK